MISILKYITLNESAELPEIQPKIKNIKDPYNSKDKAVDITFYNKTGERVGEASVSAINTDMPFLYDVEVFQPYRGQHYSTAFMKYIMKEYKPKQLTVEPSNTVAINLYKKFGFYVYGNYQDGKTLMYEMRKK